MARAGLKKVVKTIKGKKKAVRRTYWVKSESPKKRGLGPGGMIKRGGMYHRIDQYIGRASPLKKGLIAAGTVAGMLALSGGAAYGMSRMRGTRSRPSLASSIGPIPSARFGPPPPMPQAHPSHAVLRSQAAFNQWLDNPNAPTLRL